jgi:hypothetical protein
MLQISELIGDLIQAFGFHWRSFRRSGIDCRDYTRRRTGSDVRRLKHVSHARGNPL